VRLIPGDPARLLAGDFATDAIIDELRQRWRLNDPLPVQYAVYLVGLPARRPGTLDHHGHAGAARADRALPAHAGAGRRRHRGGRARRDRGRHRGAPSRRSTLIDYLATALALTGISTPIFWSGLILILLFSVTLGWLPAGGTGTLRHLVLPA
jgi:ABC-type dipeptide/oligopeptide/nickel transport system permease component